MYCPFRISARGHRREKVCRISQSIFLRKTSGFVMPFSRSFKDKVRRNKEENP
jgi:hypothetical protein